MELMVHVQCTDISRPIRDRHAGIFTSVMIHHFWRKAYVFICLVSLAAAANHFHASMQWTLTIKKIMPSKIELGTGFSGVDTLLLDSISPCERALFKHDRFSCGCYLD